VYGLNTLSFLLQTPNLQQALNPLILVAIVFGIFYFIMILPMKRKQKKLQGMIDNLKAGDKVITNGGIFGTVVEVAEGIIKLRIADNVKVTFAKSSIVGLQEPSVDEKEKS